MKTKKLFVFALAAAIIATATATAQVNYTIWGNVPLHYNGDSVFLAKIGYRNVVDADGTGTPRLLNKERKPFKRINATLVTDGTFTLQGTVDMPQVAIIRVGNLQTSIVLENDTVNFNVPQHEKHEKLYGQPQFATGKLNRQHYIIDSLKNERVKVISHRDKSNGNDHYSNELLTQVFHIDDQIFQIVKDNAHNCVGHYHAFMLMDWFTDQQQEQLIKLDHNFGYYRHGTWGRKRLIHQLTEKNNNNNSTQNNNTL